MGLEDAADGAPPQLVLERHDLEWPSGRVLRIYGELHGRLDSRLVEASPHDLHQRYDALTASWIAVSPARNERPDQAAQSAVSACALCPGGPEVPFSYEAAVFDNRFPSLVPSAPPPPSAGDGPGVVAPSIGRCEVVLYTNHHAGSLGTLSPQELARVVAIWRDRASELWADQRHAFVLAFENRGEAVGATISHPHGQIYALDRMPPFIERRIASLAQARAESGTCLSCAIAAGDVASPRRIEPNETFAVAVPFAPRWPFEVHLRARRHGLRRLIDLEPAEQVDLARALHDVVVRYDALFGMELPYMMAILEGPDGSPDWHLAVEFMPPHRSDQLLKVRASVETVTGLFINDTVPEASAERLKAIHVAEREEAGPPIVVRQDAPR
jgi:UDPglucose--hexose-1-phosphate uridylyltransferase